MERSEVSKKNTYYIGKQRYYELKHFCLQYQEWVGTIKYIDGLSKSPGGLENFGKSYNIGNPTEQAAEERAYFSKKIDLLEAVAKDTDPIIGSYILKGVTQGIPYDKLNAFDEVPCGKDMYYELYRKFFWILDQRRD